MNRKSFLKTGLLGGLLSFVPFNLFGGLTFKNSLYKICNKDQVKEINSKFWVIGVDCDVADPKSRLDAYKRCAEECGVHALIMPKCDNIYDLRDFFNKLSLEDKELVLNVLV